MQLLPECFNRCHGVYKSVQMPHQANCTQAMGIRDLFTFIRTMHFMFNNAQTRSLYSAVDKDLQIEMSCIILNYYA